MKRIHFHPVRKPSYLPRWTVNILRGLWRGDIKQIKLLPYRERAGLKPHPF